MGRKVIVVPYRQDWPRLFAAEAKALKRVFGSQMVAAHHFGSTAIPGLSAKPIIDILLIVRSIDMVDDLTEKVEALGYTAVGEYGISGRRFFYKGSYDTRTHHLHVYQADNPHILRHLAFRDYMRAHPLSAHRYAALKERLAHEFPEDMDSYIAGKNAFVKDQEILAMEWWAQEYEARTRPDQANNLPAIFGGRRRKAKGD